MSDMLDVMQILLPLDTEINEGEWKESHRIILYAPDDKKHNYPVSIVMADGKLIISSWTPIRITPEASNKIIIEVLR